MKAIIYAFKMGYLYAKGKIEFGLPEHYSDIAYWVQEYRERTSKILVETENADTLAHIYYFAKCAGKAGQHKTNKYERLFDKKKYLTPVFPCSMITKSHGAQNLCMFAEAGRWELA